MAYYNSTAYEMYGRLRQAKRNCPPSLGYQLVNAVIRRIVDSRPYWSDLYYKGIVSIPDSYRTGTVSMATGSSLVTGAATAWPTNDVVNRVIPGGVTDTLYQEVTPDNMSGITSDSILLVDPGTPIQETVAVIRTSPSSFTGSFKFTHPPNVVIQQSSLAGLQFRASNNSPIYTVLSVQGPTSIELDNIWGGPPQSGQAYQVMKIYINMKPTHKDFLDVVDQQQPFRLAFHIPQTQVNSWDPQRSSSGDPRCLVDMGANVNGNPQYELWPAPTSARQISFEAFAGWPKLVAPSDPGPWFIDPEVIINGAIGEALRLNLGSEVKKDPWFLPQLARDYDERYARALSIAVNADESKAIMMYKADYRSIFGGAGTAYWQSHDPDASNFNF